MEFSSLSENKWNLIFFYIPNSSINANGIFECRLFWYEYVELSVYLLSRNHDMQIF